MKKQLLLVVAMIAAFATARAQDLYISGAFNSYDPAGADEWKLTQGDSEDEEDNLYTIYLDVESGEFSFNFVYGDSMLVPDGVADVSVALGENTYTFIETAAPGNLYWVNNEWEGGEIGVQVNLTAKTVTIQANEEVTYEWYIRGAFNNYNPGNAAKWALVPYTEPNEDGDIENGVYIGTFEVAEGQLSFNFLSAYSNMVFIPRSLAPEVITFKNNVYNGRMDYAADKTEAGYYWSDPTWTGGAVTVLLNAETGAITVTKVGTGSVDAIGRQPETPSKVYDIHGRLVSNPSKGLYIIDGRKVFVK